MRRWRRLTGERANTLDTLFDRAESLDMSYAEDAQTDAVVDGCAALKRNESDAAALDALDTVVSEIERRMAGGQRWQRPRFIPRVLRKGTVAQQVRPSSTRQSTAAPTQTPAALPDNVVPLRKRSAVEAWKEGGSNRPPGPRTGKEWVSQKSRRGEGVTRGLDDMQW